MKTKLGLCIIVLSFILTGTSFANEKFDVGKKLDHMKLELGLTDDQVNALKPILEEYKTQMEDAHKHKMDRLKEVLSEEQMNRLKEIKKEKHDKDDKHEDDD